MSKPKEKQIFLNGIPMLIQVSNPKKKSVHKCPCYIPPDCLTMTKDEFTKAYGEHVISATWDLLQHKSFQDGIVKPKLVIE